ncbi:hypothetical protein MPER_10231, partial [Moniliophthora perniciosa FA553]
MTAFQEVLAKSKHIVAVAGAGLSAASGKGAGGLWRKYDAIALAYPDAFKANPNRVWQFYHYRREAALKARPNAAHDALARFSLPSIRQNISPGSTFVLITQNVDGLSQIALDRALAATSTDADRVEAPPKLLEMHGRLFESQ